LAENLDMVLDEQIDSQGGWSLRQALQNEPDLLLMGSAVNTFASLEDADEALYGFFHRIDLCPLDDAAARILWQSVTGVDLADGRAAAIRILTGGNPRLVTVLGRFSDQPDLSNLRADLDLLIDEYTPFFKANIEALPPVERKVFVTLADIWNPATAAEIAERTRMTSSQVSSLLGRLVRRGAVEIVEDERGKKRYELSERLYNLYHLLRRPDGEGRVRALVDILAHLHGPTELGRDVFPAIVGLLASELDTRIASCLHRHLDDIGTWESLSNGDCAGLIASFGTLLQSQIETLGADHSDSLLTRQQIAYLVSRSGEEEKALDLYSAVLADQQRVLGPDHRDTLTSRAGIAYLIGKSGDLPTALSLYRELAVDRERVLGLDHRDTLISRHMVAYLVGETGDPVAGLEIASGVLTRAEPILKSDDEFLRVARWLRDDLTLRTLRASGQPLPRELREVESAVTRPEAAPPPPLRRPR
jgi:DNA-binding transcriptional ArsR family regulator